MSSSTKRACDACHRRKVRCNGAHPCNNCKQATLACTFNKPPQKKGPKGGRAKVISELRETQKRSAAPSSMRSGSCGYDSSGSSPTPSRTSGLLPAEIIDTCVSFYFINLYPTLPVLNRGLLQDTIVEVYSSVEAYCLVGALCSFMIIQPGIHLQKSRELYGDMGIAAEPDRCMLLLEEVIRLRKSLEYVDSPSTNAVLTSFFISACYFGLDRHNTAWFHLREATTLAQNIGMHNEGYYSQSGLSGVLKRRLYWVLFVSERAYGLHEHKPLTLFATINLPTINEDPSDAGAITGFIHLVNLFRPFDDKFVGLWSKSRFDCSPQWLAQKQEDLTAALPQDLNCMETQTADLKITQQWLRTIIWQLAIANECLSSAAADRVLTFSYPIKIAQDLVSITTSLSQSSMEIHGIGLIEKLFDVACTLTDVVSCVPIETVALESPPKAYLDHFLRLISTLRGGTSRYVPLLLAKIKDPLPIMAPALLPPVSLTVAGPRSIHYEDGSESSDSVAYPTPPFLVTTATEFSSLSSNLPFLNTTSVSPPVIMGMPSIPPSTQPYAAYFEAMYHT